MKELKEFNGLNYYYPYMDTPWKRYRASRNNPMINVVRRDAIREEEAGLMVMSVMAALISAFILGNLILMFT